MKEKVRFVFGAVSVVLVACCLAGAALTAWLRAAAGAVVQTAALGVMEPVALVPETAESAVHTESVTEAHPVIQWRQSAPCVPDLERQLRTLPARVMAMGPCAPPGADPAESVHE